MPLFPLEDALVISEERTLVLSLPSVRLSSRNNSKTAERIFIKFDKEKFMKKCLVQIRKVRSALHKDLRKFLDASR